MPELGINKQQAQQLVEQFITDKITKLHLVETEAIMRALARHFGENEEEWGIIGLLHDIDWDLTKNNTSEHCVRAVEILKQAGASEYLVENIISHAYGHPAIPAYSDKTRQGRLQHGLVAVETLTGLIIASALVQPDKKLAGLTPESLMKKFKSKSFAARCDRALIGECEQAGISLEEFLNLGLKASQTIAGELGL